MEKIYFYQTIDECEKEIMDKTIIFDITHSSTTNLFECFVRTIRTIMFWVFIISIPSAWALKGFIFSAKLFGILLCIYIVGAMLMSWVKFNHNKSYTDMKVNLVDNIINECKEFAEMPDWQKKQMAKRFAELARLNMNS